MIIKYKKGNQNKITDILFRPPIFSTIIIPTPYSSIFRALMLCKKVNRGSLTIMEFYPFIFEVYSKAYVHDLDIKEVYKRLASSRLDHEGTNDYHVHAEILYHFNALCVIEGKRVVLISSYI